MTEKPLKLKAKDAEDVQVISAVLQDAIVPMCDIAYRPEEGDFIMVTQRFCREGRSPECFERVRCAVHFTGVKGAQYQGLDPARRDDMLDLLAILPEQGAVQLVFAGGGRIRLALANWSMIVEDFGEPWPVAKCPAHPENPAA